MSHTINKAEKVQLGEVELTLYGASGSESGSVSFQPGFIANYPNIALLKEAVRRQQGRLRRGTASTKGRSEISGTNKKPWRQKGTGRARAGTKKSPIWRGGGVTFGPKPRTYDYGLPKKQRKLAVRHALLSKLVDGESKVMDSLPTEIKTKNIANAFDAMGIKGTCLIIIENNMPREQVTQLVKSSRNVYGCQVLPVSDVNVLSLLKSRNVVLTKVALEQVQALENEKGA